MSSIDRIAGRPADPVGWAGSLMVLAVLVASVVVFTAGVASAADDDDEIDVVLLGDSYSAGNGAGDYWLDDACRRSWSNWAEQYLRMLREDGHEVSVLDNEACNGAVTGSIGNQADVIDEETDLVLLTIGGNDVSFDLIVGFRDPDGNAIPGRGPDRGADQLVRPRRPPQRTIRNHHRRRPRFRAAHIQA